MVVYGYDDVLVLIRIGCIFCMELVKLKLFHFVIENIVAEPGSGLTRGY